MKAFSQALIDQLDTGRATVKVLAELQFGATPLRYTDADIDIWHSGNIYLPNGMRVDRYEEQGGLATAKVELSVPGIAEVLKTDRRGATVILYWAALQPWGGVIDTAEFFRGELDDFRRLASPPKLFLSSEIIQWMEKHMIRSSATCHWPFKGTRCGYAGPNSYCDHTYSLCSAYANTDNYGGSRWLPVVSEQNLLWGRTA